MTFAEYMKQGKVILGEPDPQKAKALFKMAENNYQTAASIPVTDLSASSIFSLLYESLREVVEALCLKEGYKVYSHEALTAYLEEHGEEAAAAVFDRYRRLRNGIHYYGRPTTKEVVEEAKKQVLQLSQHLRRKV